MSHAIDFAVPQKTLPRLNSPRALKMAGRLPKISDMPPLNGKIAVDASVYEEEIQMKSLPLRSSVMAGNAVDVAVYRWAVGKDTRCSNGKLTSSMDTRQRAHPRANRINQNLGPRAVGDGGLTAGGSKPCSDGMDGV